MKKQTTKALVVTLALVSSLALSQFSQAQTFKKVSVQGGAKIAQIASGAISTRLPWASVTRTIAIPMKSGVLTRRPKFGASTSAHTTGIRSRDSFAQYR